MIDISFLEEYDQILILYTDCTFMYDIYTILWCSRFVNSHIHLIVCLFYANYVFTYKHNVKKYLWNSLIDELMNSANKA